jgi:hydroxymethylpyrimidine/phosphomethylpyrimidine kinase
MLNPKSTYSRVLTIAGTDSGGGAGVPADIKAISANQCFATCAITAITAQNTLGVTNIHPIPIATIQAQLRAVLADIGTDSVKIGMLHNSETITAISQVLEEFKIENIVLDPVMVSTSGSKLLEDEAIDTLCQVLLPKARLITPNIPEAEILLGKKIKSQDDLPQLALQLGEKTKTSVLLKAGHLEDEQLIDVLYNHEIKEMVPFTTKRISTRNTHGTGCTLSSAIAAFLARKYDLTTAVELGQKYIHQCIVAGAHEEIGKGHGSVKHFYHYWS